LLIPDFQPRSVLLEIWIRLALGYDAFKIVTAGKPELAINQRKIAEVLAIAEPAPLLFIVRPRVLIPQQIEGIENGVGTAEQQIAKLRLAFRIDADDLSIEHTASTPKIASQSFAQFQELQ
jgi:hypothetical protein